MKLQALRVLKIEPMKAPQECFIENDLEMFQVAVGGCIEIVHFDDTSNIIICNEEGKLFGLQPNRRVGNDIIVGTFYIAGTTEDDFASVSDDDIKNYKRRFATPDTIDADELDEARKAKIKQFVKEIFGGGNK